MALTIKNISSGIAAICEKLNLSDIDFIIDRYNNKRYTVAKGTIRGKA
ncbi:MAG: hypothetical protein NHB14_11335 [Desulfosporosinus sp.]|nr:hypothetical protein [Desulfosporosinus sp.]